jgi:ectoine hydroxylase-related dioxygenase (phytanoyl-CoA dioxygenase family)
MDSCLRLYGQPHLLTVAEALNGPDFTPFTDAIWVKEPGLGAAVSWHQDGTTHWDNPDLDSGTHGFNFMAQLYRTTPGNALWIMPETHDLGRIDIRQRVADNDGSDHLPGAVPLVSEAGDVAVCSRQMLHCSFPNGSPDRRVTFVFGFHRRRSVMGVKGWDFRKSEPVLYDDERVNERCRVISLAIDARAQHFPDEPRYTYQPQVDEIEANRWNEETRETVLKDYNLRDLGI